MIQVQTYLKITDNTGVKAIMCINILGNNKIKAKIGDIIIGVVKNVLPNGNIKKSSIVKALIVRTRKVIKRTDGISLRFNDNAAIIIDAENNPKGTRIFGPITSEFRKQKNFKILSLSSNIL